MADTIGTFGSNVGSKVAQKRKPYETAPGGVMKLVVPHAKAAPTIKATPIHPTQAQLGQTSSSGGSSSSGGKLSASAFDNAGGSSGPLSGLLGGAEGFLSHLSSDIVHTAVGLPMGLVYMVSHNPLTTAENMAKVTWADWSPLFHGNVGLWAHNFYTHPLAPILDVAGVLTGGAALAGRAAGLGVMAAESAAGADEAALLAARTGRLARFADPAKAATWENNAAANGAQTPADIARYTQLMQDDGRVYRVARDPSTGSTRFDHWSKNPLVRPIQQFSSSKAEAIAKSATGKTLKLDKVLGDQARFSRWDKLDKGQRAVAVQNTIERQLAALAKTGKLSASLSVADKLRLVIPVIGKIIHDNSRPLIGIKAGDLTPEFIANLQSKGLALVRDPQFIDKNEKTMGVTTKGILLKKSRVTQAKIIKAADNAEKRLPGSHDAIIKASMRKMGSLFTTSNAEHALVDDMGQFRVASNTLATRLGTEAHNSDRVLRALYQEPTKVWRHMLLGLSPRYFVNNFIGNGLMLIAATDPVNLVRAYRTHVAIMHGAKAAAELEDATIAAAAARPALMAAMAPGTKLWAAYKQTMGAKAAGAADRVTEAQTMRLVQGGNHGLFSGGKGEGAGGVNPIDAHLAGESQTMSREAFAQQGGSAGLLNKAPNLYGITHNWADLPTRLLATNYSLMRTPEYQVAVAQNLAKGMSREEAAYQAAVSTLKMAPARAIVASQVRHMLGQYHTFNKFEKGVKNYLVPFYAWDKAIVSHMHYIVTQAPYKAAMGVAIGAQGHNEFASLIGQAPDFMQSMLPGSVLGGFIGNSPGRIGAVNTQSLSPYGSVADLTNLGMTLAGMGNPNVTAGSTLGGQLNPVLQSLATQLSGTNITTGTPEAPTAGGPLVGTAVGTFGHLPQLAILQGLFGKNPPNTTKSGNPTLYEHNLEATLSSYLGIPIRQISLPAAQALADKESGRKKKRTIFTIPGL